LYEKAIEFYKETFLFEEPEAMTYYYIGECYEKLTRFDQAKINYRKAIELDPLLADAWLGIGLIYEELGKFKVAINHVLRAIEIEPMNAEFWYMLGDIQYRIDLYDDALKSYKEVAKLDPQNAEIWLDFSHIYALRKEYDLALDCLETGISEQRDNSDLYYRKFVYQLKDQQFKQAYKTLEDALTMNYENHKQIFEYDQKLGNDSNLLRLIELYRKF
jgi:tetratricopeptide (TPR) repeat protein